MSSDLLPCAHPSQTTYASNGCRCDGCRAEHSRVHRERRKRKAAGIVSDWDRINPLTSREALAWMREQGMRWTQIEGLTGFERNSMTRIMKPTKVTVARSTERILLDTVERIKRNPSLLTRDALLLSSDQTVWQIGALLARGWTTDAIEAEAGVVVPRRGKKVQRRTVDRFNDVFNRWHGEWGPNRLTAVLMWRKGVFPSEMYLWEDGDTRPIPGSLHPDLVREALTFSQAVPRVRVKQVASTLHDLGQWENERCARTSMATWTEFMGYEPFDYSDLEIPHADRRGIFCRRREHLHDPPLFWRAAE